jgi:polyisoprenyl-phosphate glycosyltransferase
MNSQKNPTISVIFPVLNEERTVSGLVELLLFWGKAKEIIVVDDGSNDNTQKALKQFGSHITVISHKVNKGQGAAIATGIKKSTGDIILTIDGDVVSLTRQKLDMLLHPLLSHTADMAIAVLEYSKIGSYEPFSEISGTRAFFRKTITEHIKEIETSRYGVTVTLNKIHEKNKIVFVQLPHVFVLGKFDKQSVPEALKAYIVESRELLTEAVRYQTKGLKPQVKNVLNAIQSYLSQALDALK